MSLLEDIHDKKETQQVNATKSNSAPSNASSGGVSSGASKTSGATKSNASSSGSVSSGSSKTSSATKSNASSSGSVAGGASKAGGASVENHGGVNENEKVNRDGSRPVAAPKSNLSDYQRDVLARTALGEAVGEGRNGMAQVLHVIQNRSQSGKYPNDPAKVALQPNQFTANNPLSKGGNTQGKNPTTKNYNAALKAVDDVFGGSDPDQTGGALMYHAAGTTPSWANSADKYGTKQIGNHVFYPTQDPNAKKPTVAAGAGRTGTGTGTVGNLPTIQTTRVIRTDPGRAGLGAGAVGGSATNAATPQPDLATALAQRYGNVTTGDPSAIYRVVNGEGGTPAPKPAVDDTGQGPITAAQMRGFAGVPSTMGDLTNALAQRYGNVSSPGNPASIYDVVNGPPADAPSVVPATGLVPSRGLGGLTDALRDRYGPAVSSGDPSGIYNAVGLPLSPASVTVAPPAGFDKVSRGNAPLTIQQMQDFVAASSLPVAVAQPGIQDLGTIRPDTVVSPMAQDTEAMRRSLAGGALSTTAFPDRPGMVAPNSFPNTAVLRQAPTTRSVQTIPIVAPNGYIVPDKDLSQLPADPNGGLTAEPSSMDLAAPTGLLAAYPERRVISMGVRKSDARMTPAAAAPADAGLTWQKVTPDEALAVSKNDPWAGMRSPTDNITPPPAVQGTEVGNVVRPNSTQKGTAWDGLVDKVGGAFSKTPIGGLVEKLFPEFFEGSGQNVKNFLDSSGYGGAQNDGMAEAVAGMGNTGEGYTHHRKNAKPPDPETPETPATPGDPDTPATPADPTAIPDPRDVLKRRAVFPDLPPYRPGYDNEWTYFRYPGQEGYPADPTGLVGATAQTTGFAGGGPVAAAAPQAEEGGGLSTLSGQDPRIQLISDAEDALEGQSPHPDAAIQAFIQAFGEDKLRVLAAQVKKGLTMRRHAAGRLVKGPGGPTDDAIPARIDGSREAALSNNEFVMPADAVAGAGNGDLHAGARALQQLSARLSGKPVPNALDVEQVG